MIVWKFMRMGEARDRRLYKDWEGYGKGRFLVFEGEDEFAVQKRGEQGTEMGREQARNFFVF